MCIDDLLNWICNNITHVKLSLEAVEKSVAAMYVTGAVVASTQTVDVGLLYIAHYSFQY